MVMVINILGERKTEISTLGPEAAVCILPSSQLSPATMTRNVRVKHCYLEAVLPFAKGLRSEER